MANQLKLPWQRWLISSTLLLTILFPLSISSNTWSALLVDSQKETHQFPNIYSIEIINEYPHDPKAFTEGLLYGGNNTLYESTGLYGESSVRRVTLQTGKVEALQKMDSSYFGEGLTSIDERLYQLTWEQKTGFIYDKDSLKRLGEFDHQMNDGWGLTTDGKILFGSDGSSTLYQFDPQTMEEIRRQTIRYKDHQVHNLNELEYVNGEVWANIIPEIYDVLNGIAWDRDGERIFVTGKNWPKLFEIKLLQLNNHSGSDILRQCVPIIDSSKAME
ncbi:glutaminyl-peptide cyclotransferase-like isoform X2 [Amaranthus tricolor]|uniref:glutaminyl-peptide cyclotransferase-like isoform X2 n=1 Tax=Amaranthus tricolor TaxID=29722 RepID=UPI0025870178|nr:glutaminyl-peptide cyclotransferase-like isoform X2 [Amaranthus tricolor]